MMTETTLTVKLSELTKVRLACHIDGCQGVMEIPVDQLGRLNKESAKCPLCKGKLIPQAAFNSDPLCDLATVLGRLRDLESQFTLEFPIRIEPKPGV